MKETRFITQNKEKWLESENLLGSQMKDPEKLSTLFTQVVDDLSYSRTYYPNRSVRVYLNKIARHYFSIIYSHKKEQRNRFKLFWMDELPQVVRHCRMQLLISLIVFFAAVAIGVFSAYKDPDFVTTILGKEYVNMTKENIAKGDPMGVYKDSNQVDMFLRITQNNLKVAFNTYVFGVFLAIGSLAVILYNGIMVGCFQFFFVEQGLFAESALTIWLHGTLEMSSMVLAGGAGLTLGTGLIFPGTYSRLQSFQISAIRSLKLMLGIAPIIVMAGLIESFLTRYTEVPDIVRLLIIILSAIFIIGYFGIYPWLKSRSGFEVPLQEVRLSPTIRENVSYTRLKNNAEVLRDTFLFYTRFFNKLIPWIIAAGIASTTAKFFMVDEETIIYAPTDVVEWISTIFGNMLFALLTPSPWFILINGTCLALILYRSMKVLDADAKNTHLGLDVLSLFQLILLSSFMFGLIYLGGWGIFFLLLSFLFTLLIAYAQLTERSSFIYAIGRAWELMIASFRQALGMQMILLLLTFSFLALLSAPVAYFYTDILKWSFGEEEAAARAAIHFIEQFLKTCSFFLVAPILASSAGYLYHSLEEINSATSLKESIAKMGLRTSKSGKR
jgi:uncharacterized membrane protein SpoIIM required for sporulation